MSRALYLVAAVVLGFALGVAGAVLYSYISPPAGHVIVVYTVDRQQSTAAQQTPFLGEGVYIARPGDSGPRFERVSEQPGAGDVVVFLQLDGCPGCWGSFVPEALRGATAAGLDRIYVVVCRSLSEALNCSDSLALSIVKRHSQRIQLPSGEEIEIPPGAPNLAVESPGAPLFSEYLAARLREDPGYGSRPLWASIAEYIARLRPGDR